MHQEVLFVAAAALLAIVAYSVLAVANHEDKSEWRREHPDVCPVCGRPRG